MPNKTLGNEKDMILSQATAAISRTLLRAVTGLFKRVLRIHYEDPKEIDQAPEWPELDKLFSDGCDTYVSVAMGNRRNIRGALFPWVKRKIEADENAILVRHFNCDRHGHAILDEALEADILAKHGDAWRAMEH